MLPSVGTHSAQIQPEPTTPPLAMQLSTQTLRAAAIPHSDNLPVITTPPPAATLSLVLSPASANPASPLTGTPWPSATARCRTSRPLLVTLQRDTEHSIKKPLVVTTLPTVSTPSTQTPPARVTPPM